MLLVVGDRSSPCGPVDEALTQGGGAFLFESSYGGGLRQAVQRHVDQRCVAACCCCLRCCAEAFPFGASGLVDVDVGVYQSRQQRVVAVIVEDGVGGDLRGPADGENLFAFYEQCTWLGASWCDDPF